MMCPSKAYYEKHKQDLQEKARLYYWNNRDRVLKYQHDHKHEIKAYRERTRQRNIVYQKEYQPEYRQAHKKEEKERSKRRYQKHRADINENIREKRLLVLKHYGNRCSCCGETEIEFLAIDHVNGVKNSRDYKEFRKNH
jgi:ribosome-binding ATPase YchF (GTP1/OBG family)